MNLSYNKDPKRVRSRPSPDCVPGKPRPLCRAVAAISGMALGAFSSTLLALGLGEIQSKSFIGQPLQANIALVSLDDNIDVDRLIVRQVTGEEAEDLGVDLVYGGAPLELTINQSERIPFISVVSREPINEPFLSLLVELRWPNGVVFREYPVLLDPPPKAPVATDKKASNRSSEMSTSARPRSAAQPKKESGATVVGSPRIELEALATSEGKYRVKSGDTLSKIAERWREGTDRGIYDTMQWLYENNLHAFTNQNIDLLRAGAVLQMPDLSAYAVDNEVPSDEERKKAVQVKEPTEGTVKPTEADEFEKAAQKPVTSVNSIQNDASRGLLTVSNVNQDDNTRELIDMLVRENESLRARMEKVENSEYLETLKQLIVLQRQQISDLRNRIGVSDTDASQEMDDLLDRLGIRREQQEQPESRVEAVLNNEELTVDEQSENAQVELASENVSAKRDRDESMAPVKVDPVLSTPVLASREDKNWLIWLVLGGGAGLIAIFSGLYLYYRRTIDSANVIENEDGSFDDLDSDSPPVSGGGVFASSADKRKPAGDENAIDAIDYEGDGPLVYSSRDIPEDAWLGERADLTEQDAVDMDAAMKEVQEAFDDLLLDESLFDEIDESRSLEALTEELPPAVSVADETTEPQAKNKSKKRKGKAAVRPSEDELKMSIAEKMAQYNPQEYRQEIENLGLMELDELSDPEYVQDEIDTTVYRALMFCEFKRYEKARELLRSKMEDSEDERLQVALDQVDTMEEDAKSKSNQKTG